MMMIQRLDSTNVVSQPPMIQRRIMPSTKSTVPKSFHHQNRLFKERKQYVSCVPQPKEKPAVVQLGYGHMQLVSIQLQDMPSPKKINIPRNWLQFYLDNGATSRAFGGGYQVSQSRPISKKQQATQWPQAAIDSTVRQVYGLQETCPMPSGESPCSTDKSRAPITKFQPIEVENSFDDRPKYLSIRDRSHGQLNAKSTVTTAQKPEPSQLEVRKITIEKNMLKLISAKSFVILCQQSRTIIYSRKSRKEREIASLTKIMTCYVACQLIRDHSMPSDQVVTMSRRMVSISGTTAGLKQGDELTVLDLLYGTMLPSGNDAALGVADAVGRFLGSETNINASQALRMFLLEMNKQAKELNLVCTNFANPHGLANCENQYYSQSNQTSSSAYDQSVLIAEAMKNELFATIVKSNTYRVSVNNSKAGTSREVIWENTNKLLSRKDCLGVKTGVTPSAGACLAANFHTPALQVIIVLLNASGVEERFTEMIHIYEYTKRKLSNL